MHKFLPLLLLLAATFAGCASTPSTSGNELAETLRIQAAAYDALEAKIGEPYTNDGRDPDLPDHVNLDRIGAYTGLNRATIPLEGFVESAVKNGYAYICRTGPEQGLVIFDVQDIEKAKQVGYINVDAGFEADIEISDDGNWAFWETQRFPISTQLPNPTSPGANAQRGIHIIDISNKANPVWKGFTPVLPDGPHSITYANITGRHIIFASTYAFAYAYGNVAPPGMQRLVIMELDTSQPIARLNTLAEYMDPDAREEYIYPASGEKFPHDVAFQVHPITGMPIAYVSYWDLGVVMLDMTDPAKPVKVGAAADFGPAGYGDIHMARPFPDLVNGRHITVAEPEISGQPDTGYMTFFDTTDPANPFYVSSWKIPGNSTQGAVGGGPHYFDAAHGRVILSHYGAGFWVIDVHDEATLLQPRTVGYALIPSGGGSAFDAWWADSTHVVASESGSGLVVFRYTGPNPLVNEPWLG